MLPFGVTDEMGRQAVAGKSRWNYRMAKKKRE